MGHPVVLFIIHEHALSSRQQSKDPIALDSSFYKNNQWGKRPNSTVRLNAVNIKAIESLKSILNITVRTDVTWDDSLGEDLKSYDIVVVNTIASAPSIKFTQDLLSWKRQQTTPLPDFIFGTETTWESALKKGDITELDFEDIYFGNLVLRHTARTDRRIYGRPDVHSARIQEFEIGIDTSVMPQPADASLRDSIVFVRAPEGRTTKNNEGIDQIKNLIREKPELNNYKIIEFSPPYSAESYWETMSSAAFLFFTSMGETFSYVLNDAKSLGVVAFFPDQMYMTSVGKKFAINTYPQVGLQYKSYEEAVDWAAALAQNKTTFQEASTRSRNEAIENFSLDKIRENWHQLLVGEPLNNKSLLIYDSRIARRQDALNFARSNDIRYVVSLRNRDIDISGNSLTSVDPDSGIISVLDYLSENSEAELFRTVQIDLGKIKVGNGPFLVHPKPEETAAYFQLLCRSYKIGKIYAWCNPNETDFVKAVKNLTTFHSTSQGLASIPVEYIYNM